MKKQKKHKYLVFILLLIGVMACKRDRGKEFTALNITTVLGTDELLHYTKYDVKVFKEYISHTVSKLDSNKNIVSEEEFQYMVTEDKLICDKLKGNTRVRYIELSIDSLSCSDTYYGLSEENEVCFDKKGDFLSEEGVLYTNCYFLRLQSKVDVFSMRWVLDSNFVPVI